MEEDTTKSLIGEWGDYRMGKAERSAGKKWGSIFLGNAGMGARCAGGGADRDSPGESLSGQTRFMKTNKCKYELTSGLSKTGISSPRVKKRWVRPVGLGRFFFAGVQPTKCWRITKLTKRRGVLFL